MSLIQFFSPDTVRVELSQYQLTYLIDVLHRDRHCVESDLYLDDVLIRLFGSFLYD